MQSFFRFDVDATDKMEEKGRADTTADTEKKHTQRHNERSKHYRHTPTTRRGNRLFRKSPLVPLMVARKSAQHGASAKRSARAGLTDKAKRSRHPGGSF